MPADAKCSQNPLDALKPLNYRLYSALGDLTYDVRTKELPDKRQEQPESSWRRRRD
jgi:hypothetical protein